MTSSGIKRGLAVSAISALAVAGLPSLATSASAAVGDSFTVVSTGPALNGGNTGAVVVIRSATGTITPGALDVTGTSSDIDGSEDNGSQTVDIVGTPTQAVDPANAAFQLTTVRIQVTTPAAGAVASFRLFEDDINPGDDNLDAGEARQPVSITTSGPLAKIAVAPASQSAAQNIASGAYTVTLQDAAGRTTQLQSAETITVTPPATVTTSESGSTITAAEIAQGTRNFTATGTTVGAYTIGLDSPDYTGEQVNASLNVTAAAAVTAAQVDIVTGADSWDGPGDGVAGGTTDVRVDQNTIAINIKGSTPNGTVTLNLDGSTTGNGITFGGKATTTLTTVLDASGNGSLTITADAGTIQVNDSIVIAGSFAQTLEFSQAQVDAIEAMDDPFFSTVGGPVDVTVTVVDQFGQPVTTGFVTAARSGANAAADATPQKKAVGADGTVTFTFTDTKATNGTTENVDLAYYPSQFAATPTQTDTATIKYTVDGQGANYTTSLDGSNTEAPTYTPGTVTVTPLFDTVDDAPLGAENVAIAIAGGEGNSSVDLSVDNGALILAPGETKLSQGEATVSTALVGGALPAGYRVIGTKSGVVTLTITSAKRTETAQFTVLAQNNVDSARDVTVSGPATVDAGTTQIAFTAVITDGFGNPVANVPVNRLNVQVTGPAQFQDGDAVTNADGQINLNVRVDADATGDVTIRVQGLGSQFGADEDRLELGDTTDNGQGLAESSDVSTATTTVEGGPVVPPVVEPVDILARLVAKNNGGKADRIKIATKPNGAAAGAKVVLFKVKGNKTGNKKIRVQAKTLDAKGNVRFTVKDRNGNQKTRYFALVRPTDKSNAARSNNRGVR